MKKDLIFAPVLLVLGVLLCLLRKTGMTMHIAISAIGVLTLVAYTSLTRKAWKIPAFEILMRAFYGIALITGTGDLSQGSSNLIGILFGLGAAVLYATVILLNKFIKGVAGLQRTFLQFVAAVMVLIPYVACTSGVTLGSMDGLGWVCLLVVGLIHTGVTYCLYFSSLKELPGQEAAILSYMDPLVAVLISVFALGETMGVMQVVGGLLILGFTLWNEIKLKKE